MLKIRFHARFNPPFFLMTRAFETSLARGRAWEYLSQLGGVEFPQSHIWAISDDGHFLPGIIHKKVSKRWIFLDRLAYIVPNIADRRTNCRQFRPLGTVVGDVCGSPNMQMDYY